MSGQYGCDQRVSEDGREKDTWRKLLSTSCLLFLVCRLNLRAEKRKVFDMRGCQSVGRRDQEL